MVAALLFIVMIMALVCLFADELKVFFTSKKQKEGSEMTEGRHRAPEDAAPNTSNLKSWQISHHVYQPVSFDNADQVADFLTSESRPGHSRREWRVWVPQEERWRVQSKETVSQAEFMDYYLETLSERLRG